MTHLDTDFLIRSLVQGSAEDRRLRKWLRDGDRIAISAVVWTEFLCGPVEPIHQELLADILGEPVPYAAQDAALAARLFNECGRKRGSLADCMIAAAAIRGDALLATRNVADFRRMEAHGLRIVSA